MSYDLSRIPEDTDYDMFSRKAATTRSMPCQFGNIDTHFFRTDNTGEGHVRVVLKC